MKHNTRTKQYRKELMREFLSPEIRTLFWLVTAFVVIGTIFYDIVEGWRTLDSFYFSVMTLTTVGYGDLSPATDLGKLFTTVYIFGGLGVVLTFLQTLAREQARDPLFRRLVRASEIFDSKKSKN